MLRYRDWLKEAKIKKKDKNNGKQHSHQGSGTIGDVDQQGETNGPHKEVQPADVHFFPEP